MRPYKKLVREAAIYAFAGEKSNEVTKEIYAEMKAGVDELGHCLTMLIECDFDAQAFDLDNLIELYGHGSVDAVYKVLDMTALICHKFLDDVPWESVNALSVERYNQLYYRAIMRYLFLIARAQKNKTRCLVMAKIGAYYSFETICTMAEMRALMSIINYHYAYLEDENLDDFSCFIKNNPGYANELKEVREFVIKCACEWDKLGNLRTPRRLHATDVDMLINEQMLDLINAS